MFFLPSEKTQQSFGDQVAKSKHAKDEVVSQRGNLFCLTFPVDKRNKSNFTRLSDIMLNNVFPVTMHNHQEIYTFLTLVEIRN